MRISIKRHTSTNTLYYIYEVNTMTEWEGWSVSGKLKLKHVCRLLLIITQT